MVGVGAGAGDVALDVGADGWDAAEALRVVFCAAAGVDWCGGERVGEICGLDDGLVVVAESGASPAHWSASVVVVLWSRRVAAWR